MAQKQLGFKAPPALAIAEGATTPNPGIVGVSCWSTTLAKPVYWDGTIWTAGSGGGAPDPLILSDSDPATPAANTVAVFGRKVGGRMMAAFKGPSGLDSSLQPSFARNNVRFNRPFGNGSTIITNGLTLSATGTATTRNIVAGTTIAEAVARITYEGTQSLNAVAGYRSTAAVFYRGSSGGKLGGFHFVWRFGPSVGFASDATRRSFCGFTSTTTAPTDVNPSTIANCLGVGCDAADTNYQIMHRTGTGTVVKVDTGIPKTAADNTELYELAMFCAPGGSEVKFEFTRFLNPDADTVFTHTATGSLPAVNTLLAPRMWYSTGGTLSTAGASHSGLYIETDF